jgi:hypothetical protein
VEVVGDGLFVGDQAEAPAYAESVPRGGVGVGRPTLTKSSWAPHSCASRMNGLQPPNPVSGPQKTTFSDDR